MNKYLLFYQLEEYDTKRFLRWIFPIMFKRVRSQKKTLLWDPKAVLIYLLALIQLILITVILIKLVNIFIAVAIIVFLWINSYLLLISARLLAIVPEKLKMKKYLNKISQKIMKFPGVTVIGISGSSGKTSTKYILSTLLTEKTLITPHTCSTSLNIAKIVERELNEEYKYFICEMGAHKTGEIKKICDIVQPEIGILTSINEQHLERFKAIENTINAKFEILQNLKDSRIGIVNLDNALIRENLSKAKALKLIGYTLEGNKSDLTQKTVSAENIRFEKGTTYFDVKLSGQYYHFGTHLLGKNHLSNILASITCALELGENPEDLIDKVNNIKQISHRMELKENAGIYLLDDTYSSNVSGFREALKVLNGFSGKKALVTPGIIEIGEKSSDVHKMLGSISAKVCDLILLVGKTGRTEALRQGALEYGYDKDKIIRIKDLDEATKFIQKNLKPGDAVLLENDLPDYYL